MRIRNRGGKGRSGGDQSLFAGREQRARSFRSTHSVGQRITGRYLKRDPSGLAWVSFDGLPLLTKIEADPLPGTPLAFVIQALVPDIVLKELKGRGGQAGDHGAAQTVVGYDAARTAFETLARPLLLTQAPAPAEEGGKRFLAALNAEQREAYLRTLLALAGVNACLARTGSARLHYLPWLAPALKLDLILRSERKEDGRHYYEAALGFDAPDMGPGHLRLLFRSGQAAVRVFLERTEQLPLANAVLTALGKGREASLTMLGAVRPPQYAQGGVLQQLLASRPHALIGLGG